MFTVSADAQQFSPSVSSNTVLLRCFDGSVTAKVAGVTAPPPQSPIVVFQKVVVTADLVANTVTFTVGNKVPVALLCLRIGMALIGMLLALVLRGEWKRDWL